MKKERNKGIAGVNRISNIFLNWLIEVWDGTGGGYPRHCEITAVGTTRKSTTGICRVCTRQIEIYVHRRNFTSDNIILGRSAGCGWWWIEFALSRLLTELSLSVKGVVEFVWAWMFQFCLVLKWGRYVVIWGCFVHTLRLWIRRIHL